MSAFKLEFTLKQHTPMIHFQSDQLGATLRATELKPKLDRFLIKYFDKNKIDYKDFLIKGQEKAFDYKVSITPTVQPKFDDIDLFALDWEGNIKKNGKNEDVTMQFPTFFATMGDEWEANKKYFSYASGKIIVLIKVLNQDLKKIIQENFASFLAYTNFGTRQSKGFGSFYLHKDDKSYLEIIKALKFEKSWSFDVSINENMKKKVFQYYPLYGEYYSLFEKIELLYKTLRSGINEKDKRGNTVFYFKSLLQNYMISNQNYDEWDKTVLKAKFIDGTDKSNESILSRDMLGLSTIQEYKNSTIGSFTIRHPNKKKDKEKYPENKVQRFKSPIIFKPIKISDRTYRVYITHRPLKVYDELFGKKILILQEKNRKIEKSVNITFSNDFDLVDFLERSFKVNIKQHIQKYQKVDEKDYFDHDSATAIGNIYNSIKEVT